MASNAFQVAEQLEKQGYFERVRKGDARAAGLFTRLIAWTVNPNGSSNSWGVLTKQPGENQVEGYSIDSLASNANQSDRNNAWDFIRGAGAPNAKIVEEGPNPRREGNKWEKPRALTQEELDYLKFDDGVKLEQTLGIGMFWLARAVNEQWPQLEDNCKAAVQLGASHVRAFANVGEDIRPDPWKKAGWVYGRPGWKQGIVDATNYVFDTFGLQVQWTLMGGRSATPDMATMERCVRDFVDAVRPILHKVKAVDLWNEYESNGGRIEEMRPLCRLLKSLLPSGFLIGMSSPTGTHAAASQSSLFAEMDAMYDGDSGCNFVPVHWGRENPPVWTNGSNIGTQLPIADNEPMGPDASVRPIYDATELAKQFQASRDAGELWENFHCGVSVWGGEIADEYAQSHPHGRQKRFTDYMNWNEIVEKFRAVLGKPPVDPIDPVDPPVEVVMIPIEEFMSEMTALHNFYRADEGLQRANGIGVFDADAIGQWLYNTYVSQREQGKSPEEARKAYQDAIRQSGEWKAKHGISS